MYTFAPCEKKKKIENKQEINKKRSKIKTKMSNKKTPNNELFPSLLRVIDLTFFLFLFFLLLFWVVKPTNLRNQTHLNIT